MADEEDAHRGASNSMAEQARLVATFGAYAEDPGRRARWSSENPGNAAMREEVLGLLERRVLPAAGPGRGLLDGGCGPGWWLGRVAAAGVLGEEDLAGVDLLPDRVAAARGRLPRADVRVGDLRELPWPDGRFGAVILLTALSSLSGREDVLLALREARRVLAPGGVVAVWEPRVPTRNAATRRVGARDMADALGSEPDRRAVTVAPPLARRLGRATGVAYPALARVRPLLSHHLLVWPGFTPDARG